MTRGIVAVVLTGILISGGGCGRATSGDSASEVAANGWLAAPVIETASRSPGAVALQGRASPRSRVVLRGETDTAFAVSADDDGRFTIRMGGPAVDGLYVIEVQDGETAVPSPFRLLVAGDPSGPIALIGAGSPTRRLDPGTGLDVIDSDGRSRIASGRAAPGTSVSITIAGRSPLRATAGADGRWSVAVGGASGAASLTVDDLAYAYPGDGLIDGVDRLQRVEDGFGLRWSLSETAQQTSWFPDRSAP